MSFEAGADLNKGDWDVGWDELLGTNADFTVVVPRDGNGNWSYVNNATQCMIQFHDGPSNAEPGSDDRAASDELLVEAIVTPTAGVTRDDVLNNSSDDAVSRSPDSGTVATRTIWATTTTGESWLRSARVFSATGDGILIGINCPSGQDASAEYQALVEDDLMIAMKPAEAR